ncbi:hypothetical protein HELRODRAFT_172951 [Helobdella robusta]|uniref:Uncharacterized protein n=1 Tax=Helobdella robusta TaxID=6412 RepID=T1F669_HELRO|nr:hypothetical protein HELRODRAFT_172951 [Helobdella robusta]ESO03922.1 hypothetical protein HELRODRAFT_172951 [Helobdella robusta]
MSELFSTGASIALYGIQVVDGLDETSASETATTSDVLTISNTNQLLESSTSCNKLATDDTNVVVAVDVNNHSTTYVDVAADVDANNLNTTQFTCLNRKLPNGPTIPRVDQLCNSSTNPTPQQNHHNNIHHPPLTSEDHFNKQPSDEVLHNEFVWKRDTYRDKLLEGLQPATNNHRKTKYNQKSSTVGVSQMNNFVNVRRKLIEDDSSDGHPEDVGSSVDRPGVEVLEDVNNNLSWVDNFNVDWHARQNKKKQQNMGSSKSHSTSLQSTPQQLSASTTTFSSTVSTASSPATSSKTSSSATTSAKKITSNSKVTPHKTTSFVDEVTKSTRPHALQGNGAIKNGGVFKHSTLLNASPDGSSIYVDAAASATLLNKKKQNKKALNKVSSPVAETKSSSSSSSSTTSTFSKTSFTHLSSKTQQPSSPPPTTSSSSSGPLKSSSLHSTSRRELKKMKKCRSSDDVVNDVDDVDDESRRKHNRRGALKLSSKKWRSHDDDMMDLPGHPLNYDDILWWPMFSIGVIFIAGIIAFCFRDKIIMITSSPSHWWLTSF